MGLPIRPRTHVPGGAGCHHWAGPRTDGLAVFQGFGLVTGPGTPRRASAGPDAVHGLTLA